MRPLARSAARVWTKRPAGPILLAVGVLVATLLAGGTELALDGAREAEETEDRARLGDTLAAIRTPGGYTVAQDPAADLQDRVAEARGVDPATGAPLHLEREALVTHAGGTEDGWRVLGLPAETLAALDLDPPGEGAALVDPGPRGEAPGEATLRVQRPPSEDVELRSEFQGQLERTVLVGDEYVHSDGDEYEFDLPVRGEAKQLVVAVRAAGNDTDFDLELVGPDGTQRLDDAGTPAQPEMPRIEVDQPAGGNWTARVHAKAADGVAFRLEADEVFDARDAQALGRLLAGEGFRAVGAQLGFTEQARLNLALERTDLSTLGPGPGGLVVLELERLQAALGLEGRVDGLLVRAGPGEDALAGLPVGERAALEDAVAAAREDADDRLDPLAGLALDDESTRLREAREARLESTARLLFVATPAGVVAGVLLATWAAGLHTRRLAPEVRVLAGQGQPRATSAGLAAAHLGPPLVVGFAAAMALSPLVGEAIARGLGLPTALAGLPTGPGLLVPVLATVPIAATAWLSLRRAVEGQDPRARDRPPGAGGRLRVAGALAGGALVAGLVAALAPLGPAPAYLAAGAAGCLAGLALLWAPALEPLLARAGSLSVPALGLYRTRSTHPQLALAAATATLVLAALLAGTALGQAATPNAELEAGGYPVVSQTPRYTPDLASLVPGQGPQAERGGELLSTARGVEFLMRVTGTGIHSADTGPQQTVYGIDRSFAQRHEHRVEPVDGVQDPVLEVATGEDAAVVSRSVARALDGDQVRLTGPQGELSYRVVGVVETRLFEGVYVSQDALPVHFQQIGGQQRVLLGEDTDPATYAADLRDALKDEGLTASTSDQLVEEQLGGQKRAGTTLQALAGLGLATALLLVVLLGVRARAERRASDAVLVAMGADTRDVALGVATETALPVLVGVLVGAVALTPAAAALDGLEGLAFPLLPVDGARLALAAGLVLVALLVATVVVAAVVGVRAVRGLDQQALRELT
jgi:hypothetical protein